MNKARSSKGVLMKHFSTSPREMLGSAWRNRDLIIQMAKREVVGRYRGSVLGIVWSFFNPILMLAVYTFVFSVVFKARWHSTSDSKTDFAIVLFAGMIVFGIFSECMTRAPNLVLANPNYVKKVVFPLEILPWVTLGAALFHATVSLGVLLVFVLIVNHVLAWSVILMPIVLLPLLLMALGLGWFLGSLGVYLRDVGQSVGIFTTVLMFLSPVFYPVANLPEVYQRLVMLNPLAIILEQSRGVLLWSKMPDLTVFALLLIVSAIFAWLGFAWFQMTRKGFADVL
jgi:lipopolysaccharide transport system permease protein